MLSSHPTYCALLAAVLLLSSVHATSLQITVLTTLPRIPAIDEDSHPHFIETLLALAENAGLSDVTAVHVLIDNFVSGEELNDRHDTPQIDDVATIALRSAVAAAVRSWRVSNRVKSTAMRSSVLAADLRKLRVHVHGEQPTYAHMFRYADVALRGRLVALLNADIVLRNTAKLNGTAFDELPPLALTLAIRPPSGYFLRNCRRGDTRVHVADRCDLQSWQWAGSSWDVHLFKAPVSNARYELLEELRPNPVFMNQIGAENRAGLFLSYSGYELHNPCLLSLAEHWHCESKTHQRLPDGIQHMMLSVDWAWINSFKQADKAVTRAPHTDFVDWGFIPIKNHTRGTVQTVS